MDTAEREAIAIELGGIPIIYASAFARLQAHAPAEVPRDRWHQFINDAGLFLDRWGRQAEALGWRPDELFGLDPVAPMARYDRMGLIWMLHGETVTRPYRNRSAAERWADLLPQGSCVTVGEIRQLSQDCFIRQRRSSVMTKWDFCGSPGQTVTDPGAKAGEGA